MSEYLFPIPGSVLRNLLDFKAKTGEQFSEKEAIADMMLAIDRDQIKPERYLAKRWSWSASKVHRSKKNLIEMADRWRKFNRITPETKVKQTEAKVKQTEAQIDQNNIKKSTSEAEVKQAEAEVKQYRTDTDNRTDKSKNINNPKSSANKNHRANRVFSPDTWAYQKSLFHHQRFQDLGITPSSLPTDKTEKIIQTGAKILDQIIRLDDHTEEDVDKVFDWLLVEDNWWIMQGNYMSISKLRKEKDEVKYFKRFLAKANAITSKPGTGNSSHTPVSAYERIHSIARATLDPEQGPLASTGTGG